MARTYGDSTQTIYSPPTPVPGTTVGAGGRYPQPGNASLAITQAESIQRQNVANQAKSNAFVDSIRGQADIGYVGYNVTSDPVALRAALQSAEAESARSALYMRQQALIGALL